MAIITDSLGNWEQLGEILVTNQWQLFDVPIINCETFRITTTVANQQDWDELKIRSAAYMRFHYPDGSYSPCIYVLVTTQPTIKEIAMPAELKAVGTITRYVSCVMSHPKKDKYSLASFARWTLKLEALL